MFPTKFDVEFEKEPAVARLVNADIQVSEYGDGSVILTYIVPLEHVTPYDVDDLTTIARQALQAYADDQGLVRQENISIGLRDLTPADQQNDDDAPEMDDDLDFDLFYGSV